MADFIGKIVAVLAAFAILGAALVMLFRLLT